MEAPVSVQGERSSVTPEAKSAREKSFPTTLELGCQSLGMGVDSVVVLEPGTPANLVRPRWLGNRHSVPGEV